MSCLSRFSICPLQHSYVHPRNFSVNFGKKKSYTYTVSFLLLTQFHTHMINVLANTGKCTCCGLTAVDQVIVMHTQNAQKQVNTHTHTVTSSK